VHLLFSEIWGFLTLINETVELELM